MKIARFEKGGKTYSGVLENGVLKVIEDDFFSKIVYTGDEFKVDEVKYLSPVDPSKILCIGLNYRDHAQEMGTPIPKTPVVFIKPRETVVGDGDVVIYPTSMSKRLDYEGELAVIIGKQAKKVGMEEAKSYIFGYTCGNDITARDLQPHDGQWSIAKGFNTFMPLGPVIETEFDPTNAEIATKLNGETVQKSNTSNLIFTCDYLVSYLSQIFTLNVGDVIITGTPSGIGPMKVGDQVQVSIENIGTLTNKIV